MPIEKDFLDAQAKFNTTYGINFSIKDYQKDHRVSASLDILSTDEDRAREPIAEYLDTLSAALQLYLRGKTDMKKGRAYDMSGVSIGKFIEEFDELMELKHESELKPDKASTYKPLLGMDHERVFNLMWNEAGRFNRPLPEIWASDLLKNRYTMEQIKDVTRDAISTLDNLRPDDLGENNRKDLANLVRAKQAMEAVRKNRGFFWRIWFRNWDRNSEEKAYLRELTEKIAEYRTAGFPVGEVEARTSALNGVRERLDDSIRTYKTRQLEKTKKKEQEGPKRMLRAFGIDAWNDIHNNYEKADAFAKEIASKLPENGVNKTEIIAKYLKGLLFTANIQLISLTLESEADKGKNADHQLKKAMHILCDNILAPVEDMGYNKLSEKYVAAQIFIDALMQKLPFVTNNPDKYGKYANGYLLNNAQELLKANIISGARCAIFEEAKPLYDTQMQALESKPEQIIVDLHEEGASKAVSAPIIEEEEIKASSLNNAK